MPLPEGLNRKVADALRSLPPQRFPYEPIFPRPRSGWSYGPGGVLVPTGGVYGGGGAGGGGGGTVPAPSPSAGGGLESVQGYPVNIAGFTSLNDVNGAEYGPLAGPALIRWLTFRPSGTFQSVDIEDSYRVDFSPTKGRDTFTIGTGAKPTGESSAPYTLYRHTAAYTGAGDGTDEGKPGWTTLSPRTAGVHYNWTDINFVVPLDSFFIKCYVANNQGVAISWVFDIGVYPVSGGGEAIPTSSSAQVPGNSTQPASGSFTGPCTFTGPWKLVTGTGTLEQQGIGSYSVANLEANQWILAHAPFTQGGIYVIDMPTNRTAVVWGWGWNTEYSCSAPGPSPGGG